MAKSFFEPKKVPTYTENIIKPGSGLKSAPVPTRQRSAARSVPKTQAIPANAQNIAAADAPSPAPPMDPLPPAPPVSEGETRSFFFDGATELTSSLESGHRALNEVIKTTIRPAWTNDVTGSWPIVTLGSSGSADYKQIYSIENVRSYGTFYNTGGNLLSSQSLQTSDSASVNNDEGVDAAEFTELSFAFGNNWNENAISGLRLYNRNAPFQDLTTHPQYTRKEGNTLIYVVSSSALDGVTEFKQRVYLANEEKIISLVSLQVISGSGSRKTRQKLNQLPSAVGSGDVLYLEMERYATALRKVKYNGKSSKTGGNTNVFPLPPGLALSTDREISIGGTMSGSGEFFSGSIDHIAIFNKGSILSNSTSAKDFSEDSGLIKYHTFEGTVAASVGNDLVVAGTETYVSSSI